MIDRLLTTVSRRRRIQSVFDGLCSGLSWAVLIAAGLLVYQSTTIGALPVFAVFGMLLGGLFGTFRPLDAKESARSVDARYRLKDRFLTAWQLLGRPSERPMERLQLEDTAKQVAQADVREVVPFRRPRRLIPALAIVLLAVVVGLQGSREQETGKGEGNREQGAGKEEAGKVSPSLLLPAPSSLHPPPFHDELTRLTERLEGNASDPKEVLATLSRMEASIARSINEFNLDAVDASLREVAESLIVAEATRFAALALKSENYAKAADELEQIDFAELSEAEQNAVAAMLRQNAASTERRQLADLEQLLEKLADQLTEQLKNADGADPHSAAEELAELLRTQELRKGIAQELSDKLGLLGLYKAQYAASQGKDGEEGTDLSDRSGNNWGTGSDGKPLGDKATDGAGTFHREQLTGILGTGPSEIETVNADEPFGATAARAYQYVYGDFQKIAEAVLESEPIPLGQRQMIRNYFERIRPKEN